MKTNQIIIAVVVIGIIAAAIWFFTKAPKTTYGICKGTCPGTNLQYHYYGPKPCTPSCPDASVLANFKPVYNTTAVQAR